MVYRHSIRRFKDYSPARKIAISFLGVIFLGSILLMLPISNKDGHFLSYLDSLFTATSATCVTGLVTVVAVDQFNLFGQIVLLLLMQIGGLGIMTLMASFMLVLKNKLTMHDKIALKEVLNQSDVFNFKSFLTNIIKYTFFFEGIGVVFLCFAFIPEFGVLEGIFKSVFTSVSAFCNAGFDVIGANSLIPYASNIIVNVVIMALIVCGGLGFVVWFDIHDSFIQFLKKKITFKKFHRSMMLHTKLVLLATVVLIFVPAIIFFIIEFNNPATIGNMNLFDKGMSALFSSVTLRTAGFATVPFSGCMQSSQILMIILMFIGGSPGGTAGGIKTTTLLVVLLCVIGSLRGKSRTNVFRRHISRDIVVRATTIITINLMALFTGIFLLAIFEDLNLMEIMFEAASALATVGLSLDVTPTLSAFGKIIIIWLMFVGRIGIMTFLMSIIRDKRDSEIAYANGHIMVG